MRANVFEQTGASQRVRVHLVTGHLGSGKSSLINRIQVEAERETMGAVSAEIRPPPLWSRSCACCEPGGNLIGALQSLRRSAGDLGLAGILVEVSAEEAPDLVADNLLSDLRFGRQFTLGPGIFVVDGMQCTLDQDDEREVAQVKTSDLTVVTRLDLVNASERLTVIEAARTRLLRLNATLAFFRADLPLAPLLTSLRTMAANGASHALSEGLHLGQGDRHSVRSFEISSSWTLEAYGILVTALAVLQLTPMSLTLVFPVLDHPGDSLLARFVQGAWKPLQIMPESCGPRCRVKIIGSPSDVQLVEQTIRFHLEEG